MEKAKDLGEVLILANSNSLKQQQQKQLSELPDKLEACQTPPEERTLQKKPASVKERQALVDRLIREAMERGEFDDLPGKGRPLRLDENPYLEPGQELAFGLLKKNGFAPEWIERDKTIRREMESARHQLQVAWQRRRDNRAYESTWSAAVSRFEETLIKLNRKIDDFNLVVPVVSLQRARLRLEDEIRRVQNVDRDEAEM